MRSAEPLEVPGATQGDGTDVTFASLIRATASLPACKRLELFTSLPSFLQEAAWRALQTDCDQRNETARRAG